MENGPENESAEESPSDVDEGRARSDDQGSSSSRKPVARPKRIVTPVVRLLTSQGKPAVILSLLYTEESQSE